MEIAMSKYALQRHNHRHWTKGDVNILLEIRKALKNKKWFLIGGTLLGAVREKRLLPHRVCLNIAILDKDKSAFDLLENIGFKIMRKFVKYGFYATALREDVYLDLHIFQEVSDGVIVQRLDPKYHPECVYYAKLPKKFFNRRKGVVIDDHVFPAPDHAEEFLTLTYGDWQTKTIHHCSIKAFEDYIIE